MTHISGRQQTLPVVEAELNYLANSAERPFNYTYAPPPGTPETNAIREAHRVVIRNLRPAADSFSLDGEGFSLLTSPTAVTDFWDEAEIRAVYYPEVERAVTAATGAARVLIFDHTLRRRLTDTADRAEGQPRQPVPRVHVDHTDRSGPQRVRDLLPAEAATLLRGRVQIINVWRPIRGPLHDAPLAVADARSIAPDDLVASDLIYRERVGETYAVRYNPAHRWFYAPAMGRDEVLLLKCYDSKIDGRARFAPHTAFDDPTAPADRLPRESIEIRTLVFHPN